MECRLVVKIKTFIMNKLLNTYTYAKILVNKMTSKQISVTMPMNLFKASLEYSREHGYKNIQEFLLDEIRKKVMAERIARYEEIEKQIDREAKAMSKKEAIEYLEGI